MLSQYTFCTLIELMRLWVFRVSCWTSGSRQLHFQVPRVKGGDLPVCNGTNHSRPHTWSVIVNSVYVNRRSWTFPIRCLQLWGFLFPYCDSPAIIAMLFANNLMEMEKHDNQLVHDVTLSINGNGEKTLDLATSAPTLPACSDIRGAVLRLVN